MTPEEVLATSFCEQAEDGRIRRTVWSGAEHFPIPASERG
jgi:hypothetical protein